MVQGAPAALGKAAACGGTLGCLAQVPGSTTSKGESRKHSRRWGGEQWPHRLGLHEDTEERASVEVLICRELGLRIV